MTTFQVRAPGRICLFGEHQDYLGYPVIAAAINRYIFIDATMQDKSPTPQVFVEMPDLPDTKSISLSLNGDPPLEYHSKRDYLRSGINVAWQNNVRWNHNWQVRITGNIPINAGASSSSAMVIAWLTFLFQAGLPINNSQKNPIDQTLRGTLGYQTEVAEFNEAGGMMDHFASSCGGLIFVESKPKFNATPLNSKLKGFVLANSGVKKNTVDDLRRVKTTALNAFTHLSNLVPNFDKYLTPIEKVEPALSSINADEAKVARGNLINRDLTIHARTILSEEKMENLERFGQLLTRHHQMLSEAVGVSHPIVDEMVQIALKAGAYGAKMNGSGFGGTMFAYAPNAQEKVVKALTDAGFATWPIDISDGAKVL